MPETKNFRPDIENLKGIQTLDKEIYDLTQEALRIPEEALEIEAQLQAAKKQADSYEEQVKLTKLKQKEKELELAQREEKIVKFNSQLNLVKTNQEYSAIQKEIQATKADNSLLEEAILKLMDDVDAASKKVIEGKEIYKQDEQKINLRKIELKEREKICQGKIDELKAKKKDLIGHVHPEVMGLYERILVKKSGVALTPMDGENCRACQMKLRAQIQNEVKLMEQIVTCENCGRILYE